MTSRLRIATIFLLLAMMLSIIPSAVTVASAASTCDWAQFVSDVTVPDGTSYAANTAFRKTWRLKNIGACTWTTSYALVFDSGERFGAPASVNFPINVAPGQTVDLSIDMTSPGSAGHYFSYWKLRNASGAIFGIGSNAYKSFWAEINVTTTSGSGYDFTANAASAVWTSGAGSLAFPGTDGDSRGFGLRKDRPRFETGSESAQAGMLFAPQNISNGYIQAVYPAIRVVSGDRFQSTIGCEYGATNCYVGYRLDYQIGSGTVRTFWTFHERYEGLTYNVDLDLSSLAGYDVKFFLVINAYGSPSGDRALWGNPVIARAGGPPPPPPPTGTMFDFGTSSSPIASGYSRVTETTAYTSGSFGWTDTSGLESRDRSALANDLNRDFVMSSSGARTFSVNLPNGTYSVNITMGDNDYAHDNMVVRANGTTMLADVDSVVGGFTTNTFNVTVYSSSLALEFSDAGGSDPTWVVNTLSITSAVPPPQADCERAQFIADVTVPDGTTFAPATPFLKTWRLKNVGTCTWTTGYSLIFDTGERMGGPDSVTMPTNVAPGQIVDVSVNLSAPNSGGTFRGYWKFKNSVGAVFGIGSGGTKSFWVEIRVSGPTATPGYGTATFTPVPPVAGVKYDFAANACQGTWFSGAGQLPCPGTDGDSRGFVLKVTPSRLENGTNDGRMGLLTYPQNVNNGYIQGFFPAYNVKSGDRFRSIVNCEYNATSCYVVFRLDYQTGTSSIQTLWAFVERYEGQLYQLDLDLSSLVGKDVKFILTVLSTGSPSGDRALWVAPMIYNPAGVATPTATGTPVTVTPSLTSAPGASTTTITADTPDPSVPHQSVAVSVTVSGAAATPTGTVAIGGADTNCTITLSNGSGSCNVVFTSTGSKTLTATYGGAGGYTGSSSSTSHTVKNAATTSIIADTPDPSASGQTVAVNVTVSGAGATPTGTVDISGADTNCTLTLSSGSGSCSVVFSTTGTKTLTATYNGDANYVGSTVATASHTVSQGSTTTTITADSPDPSLPSQSVAVSVSVLGSGVTPTGTVAISGADTNCTITLANGSGSCSVVFTTIGAKTLSATYNGDGNYLTSVAATASHTVRNATTTTITADTPDPSTPGQAVTVNFTVSGAGATPTGTVDISGADTNCSAAPLAGGSGSCSVIFNTAGAKTLTATYGGDANYAGSSGSASHAVNQGSSTTTITADAPDPSAPFESVSVTVTVSGTGVTPTGTVAITGADAICTVTLASGTGSCNVVFNTVSSKTLTATYSGDGNYVGSTDTELHTVH